MVPRNSKKTTNVININSGLPSTEPNHHFQAGQLYFAIYLPIVGGHRLMLVIVIASSYIPRPRSLRRRSTCNFALALSPSSIERQGAAIQSHLQRTTGTLVPCTGSFVPRRVHRQQQALILSSIFHLFAYVLLLSSSRVFYFLRSC